MADESHLNGAAAAGNGHFSDPAETLTLDSPTSPAAAADPAVTALQKEIAALKSTESVLVSQLADAEAAIARAAADNNAIASHASRLEGDILQTQEDLANASAAAESANSEVMSLRKTVTDLISEKSGLEERIGLLEAKADNLIEENNKLMAFNGKQGREVSDLKLEVVKLEELLAAARGEREALATQLSKGCERESDLGAVIQDLTQRNAQLEGKVDGVVERDMGVEEKEVTEGFKVHWPTAAAAVSGTVAVGATAAVVYLRVKQR